MLEEGQVQAKKQSEGKNEIPVSNTLIDIHRPEGKTTTYSVIIQFDVCLVCFYLENVAPCKQGWLETSECFCFVFGGKLLCVARSRTLHY